MKTRSVQANHLNLEQRALAAGAGQNVAESLDSVEGEGP
jgi:hypothetical protein